MPEGQEAAREQGGESQTTAGRGHESMDEAHDESGRGGAPTPPEAGHPAGGEGVGMPEEGAGRAKEKTTQPIGTEDQGDPTDSALEGEKN